MSKSNSTKAVSLKILKTLVVLSLVITVLHVVLKYISVSIYNEKHGFFFEFANRFDLNDETSVPQWISHIYFLIIAILAWLAGYMSTGKNKRLIWFIIAITGLLMSIDDVATLHEFALQSLHNTFFLDTSPGIFCNAWLLIIPFLLIGLGILAIFMLKNLPSRTTMLFVLGGVIFLVGAVVIDTIANTVPARDFLNQGALAAIEGGLQLLGSSVIIYSIADYLENNHTKQLANAWRELKPNKSS